MRMLGGELVLATPWGERQHGFGVGGLVPGDWCRNSVTSCERTTGAVSGIGAARYFFGGQVWGLETG